MADSTTNILASGPDSKIPVTETITVTKDATGAKTAIKQVDNQPPVIVPVTGSKKWTLSETDWHKWAFDTLLFSSPALIVFLTALSNGTPYRQAIYLLYISLIQALIGLLKKFAGNTEQTRV